MIKILYVNHWKQKDYWFTQFIKHHTKKNVIETCNINDNHDILICSHFGHLDFKQIQDSKAKLKIFYSGENLDRKHYKQDIHTLQKYFDLILCFYDTNSALKVFRFPLWVMYFEFFDMNANLIEYIETNRQENLKYEKRLYATLVSRHDPNGLRKKTYNIMRKYGDVACPNIFKNCDAIGSSNQDKINFIRQSIINICPENSYGEGYVTEKLLQAYIAGCIPFYSGNINEKDFMFNKDAICIYDENNIEDKIKYVNENIDLYHNRSIFTEFSIYILDYYYSYLNYLISCKLNLISEYKIYKFNCEINKTNIKTHMNNMNEHDILVLSKLETEDKQCIDVCLNNWYGYCYICNNNLYHNPYKFDIENINSIYIRKCTYTMKIFS